MPRRTRFRPRFDSNFDRLEDRALLSGGALTQFPLPGGAWSGVAPTALAVAPNGDVWYATTNSAAIDMMTPTGAVTTQTLPAASMSQVNALIIAPDGTVWYTRTTGVDGRIGHIDAAGKISEYTVDQAQNLAWNPGQPTGLAYGPDGNIWFTAPGTDTVGKVTPTGQVTSYVVTPGVLEGTQFGSITAGPDGALWFNDAYDAAIGRITTAGSITLYPAAGIATPSSASITTGPDGALWFTGMSGSIGRITTSGSVSTYTVPGGTPTDVTTGPDGALWFTEKAGNSLGRVTTAGAITIVPLPSAPSSALGNGNLPTAIATGPDHALWFSEEGSNNIGRLDPALLGSYNVISAAGSFFNTINGVAGTFEVATFRDSTPGATVSDYTATITWGDGTTSAGTVAAAPQGGSAALQVPVPPSGPPALPILGDH